MRRRGAKPVNHERWLVSYADFITLLFAFFVVLFASSQADRKKQVQLSVAMKTAFSQMGVFDSHSRSPELSGSGGANATGTPAVMPLPLPIEQSPDDLKQMIDGMLAEQVKQGHLTGNNVTTRITPDGLVVSLHDAGFFSSGSAEVTPGSLHILTTIVDALPNRPVRVEGHTDNVPIHTLQFATNWELSTARASAIARVIIEHGKIDPAKLSAAGYAEFHPVATNDTEEGRTQNRRVDIILLSSQVSGQGQSGQVPSR